MGIYAYYNYHFFKNAFSLVLGDFFIKTPSTICPDKDFATQKRKLSKFSMDNCVGLRENVFQITYKGTKTVIYPTLYQLTGGRGNDRIQET